MAIEHQLAILKSGVKDWNAWRTVARSEVDLSGANLRGAARSSSEPFSISRGANEFVEERLGEEVNLPIYYAGHGQLDDKDKRG